MLDARLLQIQRDWIRLDVMTDRRLCDVEVESKDLLAEGFTVLQLEGRLIRFLDRHRERQAKFHGPAGDLTAIGVVGHDAVREKASK
jgi:hypothetical protein